MAEVQLAPVQLEMNQEKPQVDIVFKNLTYCVSSKKQKRVILQNLNGICIGGQINAILGSSGAGKTSLLNILAKRIVDGGNVNLQGQILANNQPYDGEVFASFASYVMQNDVLLETLTPFEALQFVANLKFSDLNQKINRVNETIRTLKLDRCKNTSIGGNLLKGISGGERKRTSIGVELVTDPSVILLDEPTSGLDSFTAFIIMFIYFIHNSFSNMLRKLSISQHKTIIFTIHQPSSDIYQLFDRIFLLVEGRFIYQGPRSQLIDHFANIGFKCPAHANPMDYMMSIMHSQNEINVQNFQTYFDAYDNKIKGIVDSQITNCSKQQIQFKIVQTSFAYQIGIICGRGLKNLKRDKFLVRGRLAQSIFMGLICGGIYFGVGRKNEDFQSFQSLTGSITSSQIFILVLFFFSINHFMMALNPVMIQFPAERDVFLREENAKLYTIGAYFLGKSTVEFPFLIFAPIAQQLISYWMVGLYSQGDVVIIHMFIYFLLSFAGNSVGVMAGCLFSDVKVASGILPMFIMVFVLFGGFFQNQGNFMDWIGWIQYLSPQKYAFEAAVINDFENRHFKQNAEDYYGIKLEMWDSIGILIGFIVFYRVLAFIFLYVLKRKVQ